MSRQLPSWFVMWLITVSVTFVPGLVCAWIARTLINSSRCSIPFHRDYTFHIITLAALPAALASLRPCLSRMSLALEQTARETGLLSKGPAAGFRDLALRGGGWVVPLAVGFVLVGAIGWWNIRTLQSKADSVLSWWLPDGRFGISTLAFLAVFVWPLASLLRFLSVYARGTLLLRSAAKAAEGPLSFMLGGGSGLLWPFFRAPFLALLPLALVPCCVWLARTLRGGIPVNDPITILNAISIPLVAVLVIAVPMWVSGIPARLSAERRGEMLGLMREAEALRAVLHGVSETAAGDLSARIESLTARREFLELHSSAWPLPSHALKKFLLTFVPGLVSFVSGLVGLVGKVQGSVGK